MSEAKSQHGGQEMKGWLFKWTNYLKGWQRRWFVLSNGLLSYYRGERSKPKLFRRKRRAFGASENPAEMAHTCRGTISLHGALIHTVDACTFVVSNGGTQTFHIKAATEVERQQWVTALELAKAKAIQVIESEEDEEAFQNHEDQKDNISTIKALNECLSKLKDCHDLLTKQGKNLQRATIDLESIDSSSPEFSGKVKVFFERATFFRVATNAMMITSSDYLQLAQIQEPKWKKMLKHERDQKGLIENMVEQLARQHSHLEEIAQSAHRTSHIGNASPSEEDEDSVEFYDAQESDLFSLNLPNAATGNSISQGRDRTDSQGSDDGSSSEYDTNPSRPNFRHDLPNSVLAANLDANWQSNNSSNSSGSSSKKKCRRRIPDKPNHPLNLWSIMKNCIGKELSKIPMPVNFSEPLSMLQRLTEDYEYAEILDRASECTDKYERMAYVAAFTISSYSSTASRTGKPFNPLLGETYEFDHLGDFGWRAISEQVSHHPPMVAQYCEGKRWRCWQEFTMSSKFRGKYLQVIPLGTSHLEFADSTSHYTWRKVTTTVHNIIVGKLWIDQSGEMEIYEHKEDVKCHLKYTPYSYFSRDSQRKVKGVVMSANNEAKWVVQGAWDTKIEIAPVISTSGTPDNPIYKTGPYIVAWKRQLPPEDNEKFYNFTELACQLNEPEDDVAPTDSRFRPDQRLMENGLWDDANVMKLELEEKQRKVRRDREAEAEKAAAEGKPYESYEPFWFRKQEDPYTNSLCYMYTGEYWDCKRNADWSRCPQIF